MGEFLRKSITSELCDPLKQSCVARENDRRRGNVREDKWELTFQRVRVVMLVAKEGIFSIIGADNLNWTDPL